MRNDLPKKIQKVCIKIGSSSIGDLKKVANRLRFEMYIQDIKFLLDQGIEVVLVSSGAILTAKSYANLGREQMQDLQALSSIGQPLLMKEYIESFAKKNILCSQVLLTHDDFKNRKRYLGARNTLNILLKHGVVPILNENDTISVEEIALGDNDQLAAMTAEMVGADILLLLTEADGLYDRPPGENGAVKFDKIVYGQELHFKEGKKTSMGRGGMKSKIQAVEKVTPQGITVIVATAEVENPIKRAFSQEVGTLFEGKLDTQKNSKAWLLTLVRPGCHINIDEGAYKALVKGASLLPSGVVKVEGKFREGDCIYIKYKKKVVAAGLVEYNAKEINIVRGKKSQEIEQLLSRPCSAVLIHRNNLYVKSEK